MFPKPKVYRSAEKLAWIRGHSCMMVGAADHFNCGPVPGFSETQAVHVKARRRFGDRWVIPGCPRHHNEQHSLGVETFQRKYKVDLMWSANWFHEWWLLVGMRGS